MTQIDNIKPVVSRLLMGMFQGPDSSDAAGGAGDAGGAAGAGGAGGSGSFDPGPNQDLGQWKKGIDDASDISGLDPNLIGAQVWAESRGNPNDPSTNADGNTDKGLLQISNERWKSEICPNLTQDERQKIMDKTGKNPEDLDMTNPEEGLIGGSLEMKQKLDECGGDLDSALQYYQSGDKNGNPTYSKNVMEYMKELQNGQQLSEDPYGSP